MSWRLAPLALLLTALAIVGAARAAPARPSAATSPAGVYFGLSRGFRQTLRGMVPFGLETYVVFGDGRFRFGLPLHGLPSDLDADRAARPDSWGSWRMTGNRIDTVRAGDYRQTFTMPDASHLANPDRGDRYDKVTPFPAGLRITGLYVFANRRDDPDALGIAFGTDGSFAERGRFAAGVGDADNIIVPPTADLDGTTIDRLGTPGTGSYELLGFQLLLRYADGRIKAFAAFAPPGNDIRNPRSLRVNDAYDLVRIR
jgi:hypothetical protein